MKIKLILISALVSISLIIIFQNTEIIPVRLLFWTVSMSRIILILFFLLLGFIIGLLLAAVMMKKEDRKHSLPETELGEKPKNLLNY